MVSTDSNFIIVSKTNKFNAPFVRPKKLSTYNSSVYDVIDHAKKYFDKINNFDYLIVLQPTSPFRTSKHIDESIKEFLIPLKI